MKPGNHNPPLLVQELSITAPERRRMMEGREVRDLGIEKEREKGTNERDLVSTPKYVQLIGSVKKIQHSADPVGMGPTICIPY